MAPELYLALRHLHRALAVVSIAGFTARWAAGLAGRAWVQGRVAKTLPHVVDTLLLASAVGLAFGASLNPLTTPWLAIKIGALLAYIGLGMVALSARRPWRLRLLAGIAALAVFGHIVAAAVVKHPAGLLHRLI